VLDNLTTSIVMMTLVRKLVAEERDRMLFGGLVVVAANAGGAFSPIGDVTTTMLWVGGQLSPFVMTKKLILPALVSVLVPLAWIATRVRGSLPPPPDSSTGQDQSPSSVRERAFVLVAGLGILLLVPVFKAVTHLPPFMGMLLGLGLLWSATELVHKKKNDEEKSALSVAGALRRVDTQSVLFFLGILLAVGALQRAGVLGSLAASLDRGIEDVRLRTMAIGLASSVIDNVPLVAAAQRMYSLEAYPMDHPLWVFLAYCAGTGGSILVIGSAAGIAVMGIQRITFAWYVRHLTLPALLGYLAGAGTYLALSG
jgi:Na+/H+ antiporter NhaD/arsenite permease-like protein